MGLRSVCVDVWWLLRSMCISVWVSAFGFWCLRSVAIKIYILVSAFGVWWVSGLSAFGAMPSMAQGGLRNFTENPNQLNRKFPNHEAKVDPFSRFFLKLNFRLVAKKVCVCPSNIRERKKDI